MALLFDDKIKIGRSATVFSAAGNARQPAAFFEVGECALDCAAREAEVVCDAVDAGPAFAFCNAAGSASAQNVTARLFTDANSSWASTYIRSAAVCGWLAGYPDGSFRPEQSIIRAEAVKIVNAVLGRSADKTASYVRFSDMTASHWAYYEVAEASTAYTGTVKDGAESWTK